jgi:hypothetical protein
VRRSLRTIGLSGTVERLAQGDIQRSTTVTDTKVVLRLPVWVDPPFDEFAASDSSDLAESRLVRYFAAQVGKLSGGKLRVQVTFLAAGAGTPDVEVRTVDLVRAGRFDLGWVAARAWDELGVKGFQALQAPFLITSYPLLDRVLTSPLAVRPPPPMSDRRVRSRSIRQGVNMKLPPNRFGGWVRGPLRRVSAFPGPLPACRLSDLAACIREHGRELAGGECGRTDLLDERRPECAAAARGRVGIRDADAKPELVLSDLDRELEVGVVGDHAGDLTVRLEGVEQQIGGEVDVGALLLCLTTSTVRTPRRGCASGIRVT